MCGIVGYIGKKDSKDVLLSGLEKLEYRGYDSAGIAISTENGINIFKSKGRIDDLKKAVDLNAKGNLGIGHTRWATHGEPSGLNAHPHTSDNGKYTLVHNGVIENYLQLKNEYLSAFTFKSETDTEVIVHLIETFSNKGLNTEDSLRQTLSLLKGSYAIALLDQDCPDKMFVAKNKSPMLGAVGEDFYGVASDAMALLKETNRFIEFLDEEMAIITENGITIKNLEGETISREPFTAEIDANDMEKGTYTHFMLKEIDEQPFVLRNIIQHYKGKNERIKIEQELIDTINSCDRIHIIACGTSYHAGLVGKQFFEQIAKVPTETHIASEFVYNTPLLSEKPLFIFISQSGETADSRAVLVKIKKLGHKAITITNVPGSTLSREANYTLHLHAGPEIAVASTKAYTAQISVLCLTAFAIANSKNIKLDFDPLQELAIVANAMESLCLQKEKVEDLAKEFLSETRNAFFIGRSLDYFVCLESSLKLKEISYIQAEGFAGGELKHGTIALIEKGTPVIALSTQENTNLNIRSNVKEVAARGASTCIISMKGIDEENDSFVLPFVHEMLSPLISVIPLQLISYYAALHRGCDVDKPRNLAKSVTVE